MIKLNLKVNW